MSEREGRSVGWLTRWTGFVIARRYVSKAGGSSTAGHTEGKRGSSHTMSCDNEEDDFILRQFGEERPEERKSQKTPPIEKKDEKIEVSIEGEDLTEVPEESFYDEEEEDEVLRHPLSDFVVDPTGDLYYAWQGIVGISVFYNIIFTIMRIAFEQLESYRWVFWCMDIVTDIIYATDMVVQMNISYINDGIYVTDKQQLKDNYLRTKRFTYDAVAILPLPYLTLITRLIYWLLRHLIGLTDIGITVPISEITLLGFCRLPRLVKYRALSEFFASMESRTNGPDTFRAFNLIVYLLVIIHWIACVYYCISWFEGFGMNSWVYPATEEGDDDDKFLRKYTVCFYWSFLTLTTIGGSSDPETNLEYLFTGLTFFNGVFVFAAVVGNVGDVISNMNAARTEFQAKVDDIKRYMVHHHVPDSLQKRVKKWFDYSWARTNGVDESALLETLPDKLRARIQIQIHLKTLKKVTIFEKCETGLLCELVLKLRPQIFSPKDYVCRRNEIGKEMYIINHGKLECIVTTESGEKITVATLTEGKYFGEIALLSFEGNNRRTADVRSVGYSELLVLSKKALMSALVDYPDARKQLEYQAQLRISSNRKMSSALKESSSGSTKTEGSKSLYKNTLRGGSGDLANRREKGRPSFSDTRSDIHHNASTRQGADLRNILSELRSFDSMATKQRIRDLENTINSLKESVEKKTGEHEEAMVKLKALQDLHSSHHLNSSVRGTPKCNGHDPKVAAKSRSSKLKNITARLNEQASLENCVSDRTRKILENKRRERLSSSTQPKTPGLIRSHSNQRSTSISRQPSFVIDTGSGLSDSDTTKPASKHQTISDKHISMYLKKSISHLVQETDLPTVEKYLKNSVTQSMRHRSQRPRHQLDCQEEEEEDEDQQSESEDQAETPSSPSSPSKHRLIRRFRKHRSPRGSQLETIVGSGCGSATSLLPPEVPLKLTEVPLKLNELKKNEEATTPTPPKEEEEARCSVSPESGFEDQTNPSNIDNLISTCDEPFDNDVSRSFEEQSVIRGSLFNRSQADCEKGEESGSDNSGSSSLS